MIAAREPSQRPHDARLLVVDRGGSLAEVPRATWVELLARGDVVVANDAATMPASLSGTHVESGAPIELRLAARRSLDPDDVIAWTAVVFGAGDWRTRTEDRLLPPALAVGDRLALGPLTASVAAILGHPRLVAIRFQATPPAFWEGLTAHGRVIQYAHLAAPLALWDVQTPIAARPVALEPPSAGFALDWKSIRALRARGVRFTTLTHAAGLSSTGDHVLDARLPLDEPYTIPASTARAVEATRRKVGRVVAIGTTVVRALEHAASRDGVREGPGLADNRIDASFRLRVVDVLLTGTHEAGTSHHALLRAFVDADTLHRVDQALERGQFRTHEFGDSVFVERSRAPMRAATHPFAARVSLV
jgi:S-adenosylmethionine:tRNA ribosyltransferase-isomerase